MPMVSTTPAMPGKRERRADGAHDAEQDDDVRDKRDVRRETGEPVINQHEQRNQNDRGRRTP